MFNYKKRIVEICVIILLSCVFGAIISHIKLVQMSRSSVEPKWSEESLLSRDPISYSPEAIRSSPPRVQQNLQTELAMAHYYGAVFQKDFTAAYAYLAPEIHAKMSQKQFGDYWNQKVSLKGYSGDWAGMEFGWVKSFRFVRSYPSLIENSDCMLWVISADVYTRSSTAKSERAFTTQQVLIDAWLWKGGRACVIPEDMLEFRVDLVKGAVAAVR